MNDLSRRPTGLASRHNSWRAADEFLLLGLLTASPMHGYGLRHAIAQSALPQSLSPSGIYITLHRLTAQRLVTSLLGDSRVRDRVVYEVTAAGRDRFEEILKAALSDPSSPERHFETALFFSGALSTDEVRSLLNQRLDRNMEELEQMRAERDALPPGTRERLVADYRLSRVSAQSSWLRQVIKR